MNMKFASAVPSFKNNAKFAFSAIVVAGAMLASNLASATVVSLGVVPISPNAPLAYSETHTPGVFTDTVNFTLAASSLSSSASNLFLQLGSVDVFNITGLSYSLYTASGTQIGGSMAGTNTTYKASLTAGESYYFKITGNAVGVGGGIYGLSLLSAVPEPETYGMMLGGLGLVGFMARRRKAANAA